MPNILVKHPSRPIARLLMVPDTACDTPLSVEDEILLALYRKASALEQAVKIALTNLEDDPNYPETRKVLSEAIKEQQ